MEHPIVGTYREFAPSPALRPYVRVVFAFTPGTATPSHERMTSEFLVRSGDRFCSSFADAGASIVVATEQMYRAGGIWHGGGNAPSATIIGALTKAPGARGDELPEMMGVFFRPGRLSAFASVPADELTDRIVGLEDIWGARARSMPERFTELPEPARVELMESVLLDRLSERDENDSVDIHELVAWVGARGGQVSVEEMARAAGVSRQHLTRVFRDQVGVSPKRFCRLARFRATLRHAHADADWARAAAELGYADQSHLIAEFHEFSGSTPDQLVREGLFHPFLQRGQFSPAR